MTWAHQGEPKDRTRFPPVSFFGAEPRVRAIRHRQGGPGTTSPRR